MALGTAERTQSGGHTWSLESSSFRASAKPESGGRRSVSSSVPKVQKH